MIYLDYEKVKDKEGLERKLRELFGEKVEDMPMINAYLVDAQNKEILEMLSAEYNITYSEVQKRKIMEEENE